MKNYGNKNENEKKSGSCKRRVVVAMAGLLTIGALAGVDAWRTAGVVFAEWYRSVNNFRRSSGTATTPTLGSIVQNG